MISRGQSCERWKGTVSSIQNPGDAPPPVLNDSVSLPRKPGGGKHSRFVRSSKPPLFRGEIFRGGGYVRDAGNIGPELRGFVLQPGQCAVQVGPDWPSDIRLSPRPSACTARSGCAREPPIREEPGPGPRRTRDEIESLAGKTHGQRMVHP